MSVHSWTIERGSLPDQKTAEGLFAQWIIKLSDEQFGIHQYGSSGDQGDRSTYTFGEPKGPLIEIESVTGSGTWVIKKLSGVERGKVESLIDQAAQHAQAGNFGSDIVFETVFSTKDFQMDPRSMLHFVRRLGDQVSITGPRRLSDRVLLDFTEVLPDDPPEQLLFTHPARIKAQIFVPGPTAGPLTTKVADGISEMTAAICALALGEPVDAAPIMFPANAEISAAATAKRTDPSILTLAREGQSLDVFSQFAVDGGGDALLRIRGSLLSYHAALQQAHPDIATILFVSAIEALIAPRAEWGKQGVTNRFIKAVQELCPDAVDALVEHANVEQAFGWRKRGGPAAQRKALLDRIYELRSAPSHAGIGLSGNAALSALGSGESARVALLSDLARAALLAFIQAPRSFLTGYPPLTKST